eukprot:g3873.t1
MLVSSDSTKEKFESPSLQEDSIVILNVGGRRFHTRVSTLCSAPNTLLGAMFSERNRAMLKPDSNGEFFFDRDPDAFSAVINFHRNGKLFVPPGCNSDLVKEELLYFQITDHNYQRRLYTWGRGEYGQLGHGDRRSIQGPRVVSALLFKRVKCVSLGTSHSAALTFDNQTYTWGYGGDGRLGHGNEKDVLVPKILEALIHERVTSVVCGELHTAALTYEGDLYTWGLGKDGRLGHGDRNSHFSPVKVVLSEEEWQRGGAILDSDNEDSDGELEDDTTTTGERDDDTTSTTDNTDVFHPSNEGKESSPRIAQASSEGQTLLSHLETSAFERFETSTPSEKRSSSTHSNELDMLHARRFVSVACGGLHTAALTGNGDVWMWGLGKDGRLGHGNEVDYCTPKRVTSFQTPVKQVICGGHHSAALTEKGAVYTWGFDDDGRLGHGSTGHQLLPKQVSTLEAEEIVMIACGCWHSAALTADGAVYTWGSCKSGQLGQAHRNAAPIPRVVLEGIGGGVKHIACGTAHTAAITDTGELYTWGKCDDGRLGYDCVIDQTTPKLVEALRGKQVIDIQCGVYDTAALVQGENV